MQSRFVQRQLVDGRPEVQDVALSAAIGVEALEDVLAQMGREGRLRVVRAAVERAGPAALQAAAAQVVEQSQMLAEPAPCVTCWRRNAKSTLGRAGRFAGVGLTGGGVGATVALAVVTTSSAGKSRLWPTAVSLAVAGNVAWRRWLRLRDADDGLQPSTLGG